MHLRVDASFLTLFPSLILCATVTNRNKPKFSQNLLAKVSFSLSPIVQKRGGGMLPVETIFQLAQLERAVFYNLASFFSCTDAIAYAIQAMATSPICTERRPCKKVVPMGLAFYYRFRT